MRLPPLSTAIVAAVLTALAAAPALAGYGAFATDPAASDKVGLSWDKPTQHDADAAAMHDCGGGGCKIMFRTRPHQCSAVATGVDGKGLGAAYRGSRDAAALAAMNDCQKRAKGQCKVRVVGCNR
jgi:hypothetical protein